MDPHRIPYTKISSKWIIRLNVSAQTLKLLGEKNHSHKSLQLWVGQWFLRHATESTSNKRKNKLRFIKAEKFCTSKDIIKEVKIQPMELKREKKKICKSLIPFDKGFRSRIYKEYLYFYDKKSIQLKMSKGSEQTLLPKRYKWLKSTRKMHNVISCCCSVAKLRPTLCYHKDCSTPGFPVLHHLLEFAHIHVH